MKSTYIEDHVYGIDQGWIKPEATLYIIHWNRNREAYPHKEMAKSHIWYGLLIFN